MFVRRSLKLFVFLVVRFPRPSAPFTLQAISEEDCRQWLNAMDGKEPVSIYLPSKLNMWYKLRLKGLVTCVISQQGLL